MRRINILRLGLCSIVAVAILLGCAWPNTAHADKQTVSLTAIPAVLDIGGQPGAEVDVSFQLKNNSKVTLPIHMNTRDSRSRDGQPADLMRAISAKSWFDFSQPDFILQPDETKTIEATLRIPKDASPGGHYADLVVQPLSLQGSEQIVSAQPELVVQALVTVGGNAKENIAVTPIGPSTVLTTSQTKEKYAFEVKNNGNIHALFQPHFHIYKGDKEYGKAIMSPVIILPQEITKIEFNPSSTLPMGIYRMQVQFNYGTVPRKAESPFIRVIVSPFSPFVLLTPPVAMLAFYGYRHRDRLSTAVRIITKGERENT